MMTVVMLPALFGAVGFGTDLAVVVLRKQQLQSLVDSAAAAGGLQFGQIGSVGASAEDVARAYARAHGYDLIQEETSAAAEIPAGSAQFICRGAPDRLDIEARERVRTFFLRVVGIDGITIAATSSVQQTDPAREGPVNKVSGTIGYRDTASSASSGAGFGALTPIALNVELFRSQWALYAPFVNMPTLPTATLSADTGLATGDPLFWLIRLSSSPGGLANDVRQGCSDAVQVGQTLAVQPVGSGEERQALRQQMGDVAARLAERTSIENETSVPDETNASLSWRRLSSNPRVLLVPVVERSSDTQVVVRGFAAIEVKSIDRRGQIRIQLVNVVAAQAEVDPSVKAANPSTHYGLYGVRAV
jgi:hypothetical protein